MSTYTQPAPEKHDNFFKRHKILTAILGVLALIVIASSLTSPQATLDENVRHSPAITDTKPAPVSTVEERAYKIMDRMESRNATILRVAERGTVVASSGDYAATIKVRNRLSALVDQQVADMRQLKALPTDVADDLIKTIEPLVQEQHRLIHQMDGML